jgi:type IV fimbrial biogenesis protein FimT
MASSHLQKRQRPLATQAGLSTIDLIMGMALAVVLLGLAMPPVQGLLSRYRTLSEAHELSQLLLFARGEAIRRGARVTVCRSTSFASERPNCDGERWDQGWIAFLDNTDTISNRPGVLDGADLVLRVGAGRPTVRIEPTATYRDWLAFTPTGRPIGSTGLGNGTFCLLDGSSRRDVVIAVTGRVSVTAPLTFPAQATC